MRVLRTDKYWSKRMILDLHRISIGFQMDINKIDKQRTENRRAIGRA